MTREEIIALTRKIEGKFDAMNLKSGDKLTKEQILKCSKYYETLMVMANELLVSEVISSEENRELNDNVYWPVVLKIHPFLDNKLTYKGQKLTNKLTYAISLMKIHQIEREFNKIKNLPEVVESYNDIDKEIQTKCTKLFYKLNDIAETIGKTGVYGSDKDRKYIDSLASRIFMYVDEKCSNRMFADSFKGCYAFHFGS